MQLKNKEYFLLFGYLGIILLTFPLIDIFIRAWNREDGLIRLIANILWYIDPSGVSIFITLISGFYIGSIILMFLDRKKRTHAIILGIGFLIIFLYIISGNVFSNVDWNFIYFFIGTGLGIILGGGLSILEGKKEFRMAPKNISYFSFILILPTILTLLPNNENIVIDAMIVGAFVILFGETINYEIKGPKIFILGPKNSGKTLFLAGCYLRALNISEIPVRPSRYLLELIDEIHRDGVYWPSYTPGIKDYQFNYETGKYFPKDTVIKTVDYPGPYLEKIVEYMDKESPKDDESDDYKYFQISQEVKNSNKLIFIIDGGRFPNFGDMGIIHYIRIINKMNDMDKKVECFVVVTKSDIFKNEYDSDDYEEFKKYIEEKFSKNINVKQLLSEATNISFYPVYYYTKKTEGGYVPMRDDYGNVFTYGFDKFMDDLII